VVLHSPEEVEAHSSLAEEVHRSMAVAAAADSHAAGLARGRKTWCVFFEGGKVV